MCATEPMYATIGITVPGGRDGVFEQKYDGMRVIALVGAHALHLLTRNGREKREQFPEIVDALKGLARHAKRPVPLDGEIVAIARGNAAPFQALQSRFHRKRSIAKAAKKNPAAIVFFDILRDGRTDLTRLPLSERRARLETLLQTVDDKRIRISESSSSAARMIAKARGTSPFAETVKAPARAHWVAPKLVAEVKFAEWTSDGRLRQAVFLGVRDDKNAREVHKERESVQKWAQEIA